MHLFPLVMPSLFLAAVFGTLSAAEVTPSTWPQFRGPAGNAVAAGSLPLSFGPAQNVRWKTELLAGHSSPCIWGDRIYLTGHEGTRLKMICLERSSGHVLWERERAIEKLAAYEHVAGGPANPTPATDGARVVFLFDDFGVIATDRDGGLLWEKTLPATGNRFSYGASPVIDDGRVYLNRDGGPYSSLLCLDAASGAERWATARTNAIVSFCTPYLLGRGEGQLVLAGGSGELAAYQASTGTPVWHVIGLPAFTCPSPVSSSNMIVFGGWTTAHVAGRNRVESLFDEESGVPSKALQDPVAFFASFDKNHDGRLTVDEFPKSRARDSFNFGDQNKDGFIDMAEWAPLYNEQPFREGRNVILGIAAGGHGDATRSQVRWEVTKGLPYVASPLAYRGQVYLLASGGFVTCLDLETGRALYAKERLGVGGEYYASPVAAGDHVIVCSHSGTAFLIKAGDQLEITHRTDLGEPIFATPAVVDGTLYLRAEKHLWAFGGEPPQHASSQNR